MARRALSGSLSATAIASATGRREPAPSSCASRVAQRQLLSRLPRTAPAGGEGAHRRHPEAYIQGISTRSVDDLVKALGMSGTSKSQVSRLCQEIDERVMAFLERAFRTEVGTSFSTEQLGDSMRPYNLPERKRRVGRLRHQPQRQL